MLLTTQIELKCNKLKLQDNREYTGIFAKYVWENVGTVVKQPHSSIVSSSILSLGYCGVLCMLPLSVHVGFLWDLWFLSISEKSWQ